MATTGNYTLSLTLNELLTEAFDCLQVAADGETLEGDMLDRGIKSLNMLLQSWTAHGSHLWTYTEGTLFLSVGQAEYDFNSASTHVANTHYLTTTTADTAALATTFAVSATTNMAVGQKIGIIQSDSNLFWTTIKKIDGLTITPLAPITLATASGAAVRFYNIATSTVPELIPVSRILDVRRKENDDYEIPILFESRKDYFNLPNKAQTGTPIQAYYQRNDVAGEASGTMFIWSAPSSSVPQINFTYERKLQVFSVLDTEKTMDIPDYAQDALIWNVAKRLIPKYGQSEKQAAFIMGMATETLDEMLSHDTSVYPIQVVLERYG